LISRDTPLSVHPEVADALADGRPVVALESTIISHGLPADSGLDVARRIEQAVRKEGAVPATIAIIGGCIRVGLEAEQLQALVNRDDVAKASIRDIAIVLATGGLGATTVASTSWIAARAGITTFATGGLGGVHREAAVSWDESADLYGLAQCPITVVCAGVKSILDVPATLERLESLSVSVVGYRTNRFPGFYVRETPYEVPWRLDSVGEVAAVMRMRERLGLPQALVVANPIAESSQLDPIVHDEVLHAGLAELERQGIAGKAVTPFLLGYFHERTAGASLRANIDLVLANARLAGAIAREHSEL
jgi:pseudouridine-5'-phosphate glycosidase